MQKHFVYKCLIFGFGFALGTLVVRVFEKTEINCGLRTYAMSPGVSRADPTSAALTVREYERRKHEDIFNSPSNDSVAHLPNYFSCCECFRPEISGDGLQDHHLSHISTYTSSALENTWLAHASDPSWIDHTCDFSQSNEAMREAVKLWQKELRYPTSNQVFSRYSTYQGSVSFIEPLAFLLRHPLAFCGEQTKASFKESIGRKDWLVLADKSMLGKHQRRILVDAGASYYDSGAGGASTKWFIDAYEERGIVFDAIYGWEAKRMDLKEYWSKVPAKIKDKLTLFNHPASADPLSSDNPVAKLVAECRVEDFCVLKIDVDTPQVELPWIQQILQCHQVSARIDELFFEHHVHGQMEKKHHCNTDTLAKNPKACVGFPSDKVSGTYADTYSLLLELRYRGIRAHSWV